MNSVILYWILCLSFISFVTMGLDKQRAKKHQRRIPEKNLWLIAIIGGGIGAYLGMQVFRHKTMHTSFRIGFLSLAIIYLVVIAYIMGFITPSVQLS